MVLAFRKGIINNLTVSSVKSIYNFLLSSEILDGPAVFFFFKKNCEGEGCFFNFVVLFFAFF